MFFKTLQKMFPKKIITKKFTKSIYIFKKQKCLKTNLKLLKLNKRHSIRKQITTKFHKTKQIIYNKRNIIRVMQAFYLN